MLGIGPPGPSTIRVVFPLLMASLGLGIIGLFTRTACAIAVPLCFYWWGLGYSYDQVHHGKVVLVFSLVPLVISPCGARLSLDSLIAGYRSAARGADPRVVPQTSTFAGWPLRLAQIVH